MRTSLKKLNPSVKVIVDGGMNPLTIQMAKKAGADDFISGNYPESQRLKYHFTYLMYNKINKQDEATINGLESYFKRKNKYYDTEEEMIEKKQNDYTQAKSDTDVIVSNLHNILKQKKPFEDLLKQTFNNFKTNCPDFFDLSTKQKERILYKAVNNIDFSKITN